MCSSCKAADELQQDTLETFTASNESAGMRYHDDDGDILELSRGVYPVAGSDILVFYMKVIQDGDIATVRVPVDVLLEMMDEVGIKVPLQTS